VKLRIIIPGYSDKVRPGPLAKLTVSLAKGQWEISLKLFNNCVIKLIKQQISPENPNKMEVLRGKSSNINGKISPNVPFTLPFFVRLFGPW